MTDKKALRRTVINDRRNLDAELRTRYSAMISEEIFSRYFEEGDCKGSEGADSAHLSSKRLVCSYVAFRGEVDLEPLHRRLLEHGHILLLPYVDSASNTMLFCEVKSLEDLNLSPMGIPEPDPNTCKIRSYEEIWQDNPLVLTPGVAFTRVGDRMGYGGGFYDRFFESSKGRGTKIGICYRMQLREELPTERHDIRVDEVVYAPKKVLLGLSGGVDSAVAAYMLKEQGYEVAGAHLRMWKPHDTGEEAADASSRDDISCDTLSGGRSYDHAEDGCSKKKERDGIYELLPEQLNEELNEQIRERYRNAPDLLDAHLVARTIGIPLYSCDLRREFREEVVGYFAREYLAGRTPNPCTYCNRRMKFHSLIRLADEIGAEYIATGHYARIERNRVTGRFEIIAPADRRKDQGYMLSRLSQEQLSRFLTPLAGMKNKAEVREIAARIGLHISEKKDSQEICFVDQTYLEVLQGLGFKGKKGDFILDGKVAGKHRGIEQYTIGQRKGLGAFGRPVFVVRIDQEKGDVVLGDNSDLFSREVYFGDLYYVSLPEGAEIGRCTAKIRYAAGKEDCTVEIISSTGVARFDEPQRAATPGQVIVFYDSDKVLASGIIEQQTRNSHDGKDPEGDGYAGKQCACGDRSRRDVTSRGGSGDVGGRSIVMGPDCGRQDLRQDLRQDDRLDVNPCDDDRRHGDRRHKGEKEIYLDAAATTYPRKEAVEAALSFPWHNPSSIYRSGVEARKKIDRIRKTILSALGAEEKDLIFTSGGTESNNMAIFSALRASSSVDVNRSTDEDADTASTSSRIRSSVVSKKERGTRILMSGIDHASVNDALLSYTTDIEEIPIDRHGHLLLDHVEFKDAALICITHVNNEIGTIADIESVRRKIAQLPEGSRPLLFVDGVQALGKIPLSEVRKAVARSDFYSISAHKIHGLKGTGALIANKKRLQGFHIGGGQEAGLRGGTENTPGIAGFGTALELLAKNWNDTYLSSAHKAKNRLLELIEEKIGSNHYVVNTPSDSTPFILSISLKDVKSEIVIHSLAEKGIFVSGASACSSTKHTLSRVISKIGTEAAYADGTVRISLPPEAFYSDVERPLTDGDFVFFAEELAKIVFEIQKFNKKF